MFCLVSFCFLHCVIVFSPLRSLFSRLCLFCLSFFRCVLPCCLGVMGTFLVMDGLAQSEHEYCTATELQGHGANLTYRWITQHTPGCLWLAKGLCCAVPTCLQGLAGPTPEPKGFWFWFLMVLLLLFWPVMFEFWPGKKELGWRFRGDQHLTRSIGVGDHQSFVVFGKRSWIPNTLVGSWSFFVAANCNYVHGSAHFHGPGCAIR